MSSKKEGGFLLPVIALLSLGGAVSLSSLPLLSLSAFYSRHTAQTIRSERPLERASVLLRRHISTATSIVGLTGILDSSIVAKSIPRNKHPESAFITLVLYTPLFALPFESDPQRWCLIRNLGATLENPPIDKVQAVLIVYPYGLELRTPKHPFIRSSATCPERTRSVIADFQTPLHKIQFDNSVTVPNWNLGDAVGWVGITEVVTFYTDKDGTLRRLLHLSGQNQPVAKGLLLKGVSQTSSTIEFTLSIEINTGRPSEEKRVLVSLPQNAPSSIFNMFL